MQRTAQVVQVQRNWEGHWRRHHFENIWTHLNSRFQNWKWWCQVYKQNTTPCWDNPQMQHQLMMYVQYPKGWLVAPPSPRQLRHPQTTLIYMYLLFLHKNKCILVALVMPPSSSIQLQNVIKSFPSSIHRTQNYMASSLQYYDLPM